MTQTIQLDERVIEALRRLEEQARRLQVPLAEHLDSFVKATAAGPRPAARGTDEWLKQFYAWVNSHEPLPQVADDSRESIYPDRC